MICYADDTVIMCQSKEEAEAALGKVKDEVEKRGLIVHPHKTHWPRRKSLNKVKDRIREKTKRRNGKSMAMIIAETNRMLRGWFEDFKHNNHWTFLRLDGWIRRRLRSILRKREQLKGISRGRDYQCWPNAYFRELGFFSLKEAHSNLLQSSRG